MNRIVTLFILALLILASVGCAGSNKPGPAAGQPTFASPEAAVAQLVDAARKEDRQQVKNIFGPGSEGILESGDPIADENARKEFLEAYDEKHQIVGETDGAMGLIVGNNEWPMPVPLRKDAKKGVWYFDGEAGKEEIINRRVGTNELDAIKVCQAIGDAQREYAQQDPNGDGLPEYAAKFLSDEGKKNGLYWKSAEGEPQSPLGELVADAAEQGYTSARTEQGQPRPYHGYYYRILTRQGANAPGGAFDYMVDGKLIGGFAVVAWPASYGKSGVMTFITNTRGDVYQRDLGPQSDEIAKKMAEFDPDAEWKIAE